MQVQRPFHVRKEVIGRPDQAQKARPQLQLRPIPLHVHLQHLHPVGKLNIPPQDMINEHQLQAVYNYRSSNRQARLISAGGYTLEHILLMQLNAPMPKSSTGDEIRS